MSDAHNPTQPHREEWNELCRTILGSIREHHERINTDMRQMRSLIEDAIGKLVAAYHLLQAKARIGEQFMLDARREASADDGADDEASSSGPGVGTTAALTALQFEDVLIQLLHRLRERCDRFRPLPSTLVEGVLCRVEGEPLADQPEERLEDVRQQLTELCSQLEATGERDIGQSNMEPGSVEVF